VPATPPLPPACIDAELPPVVPPVDDSGAGFTSGVVEPHPASDEKTARSARGARAAREEREGIDEAPPAGRTSRTTARTVTRPDGARIYASRHGST
jgi:hypothetical protein